MKVFKSKIDLWLLLIIYVPVTVAMVMGIVDKQWEMLAINICIIAVVTYLFTGAKYIINNNILYIKIGAIQVEKLDIHKIKKIEKTFNPLSAPALSLKRLKLSYGESFGYTLISPKEREQFINAILEINPCVEVKV